MIQLVWVRRLDEARRLHDVVTDLDPLCGHQCELPTSRLCELNVTIELAGTEWGQVLMLEEQAPIATLQEKVRTIVRITVGVVDGSMVESPDVVEIR